MGGVGGMSNMGNMGMAGNNMGDNVGGMGADDMVIMGMGGGGGPSGVFDSMTSNHSHQASCPGDCSCGQGVDSIRESTMKQEGTLNHREGMMNREGTMHNSREGMNPNDNMGGGSSFMLNPNQFPSGVNGSSGGAMSADLHEAGRRLERMEQERAEQAQHRQQVQIRDVFDKINNNDDCMAFKKESYMAFKQEFNQGNLSGSPPAATGVGGGGGGGTSIHPDHDHMFHQNQERITDFFQCTGAFGGGCDSTSQNAHSPGGPGPSKMPNVEFATQFVKRDPGVEQWKALELAKAFDKSDH